MNVSISRGFVGQGITMASLLVMATHGAWAAAAFTVTAVPIHAREESAMVPIGERQLFLDDYVIAEINGLTRTMHQPAKKGAVIRPNWKWGEQAKTAHAAPIWNPERKVFQFWDLYANQPPCNDVSGYYESSDGLHWSKPIVGQIEFRGSKENNYVAIPLGDGRRTRPGCVVYDAADPDASRRYKALGTIGGGMVHGVSPDGINWRALDVPPIPSEDTYSFSFDEQDHLFIATVKGPGPYGRSVKLATSKDFDHWTKPELIFHADELDQELGRANINSWLADPTLQQPCWPADPAAYNVDVYRMGAFRYEGLYIGLPELFHSTAKVPNYRNTVGVKHIQLACSRNLHDWQRLGNRRPFIGPSRLDSGAYDLLQIAPPANAVLRGNELWFYYDGCKNRGTSKYFDKLDPDMAAVCLAVLRRDGFISLDAGEQAGSVITKPMRVPKGTKHLLVNVDASEGEMHVLICDMSGQPLPGFGIDESIPLKGDQPSAEVTWNGKSDISALAGKEIQIRFRLRNAGLYAFWFEQSKDRPGWRGGLGVQGTKSAILPETCREAVSPWRRPQKTCSYSGL